MGDRGLIGLPAGVEGSVWSTRG